MHQRVREAERDNVFNEFKDRKGELISGIVRRFERGALVVVGDAREGGQDAGRHARARVQVQGVAQRAHRRGFGAQARTGDERAPALLAADHALVGQLGQRAAHRDEADARRGRQLRLGGQLGTFLQPMLVDVLQNKRYRLFVERSHSNLPGWESGVADRVIKRRPLRVLDCMTFAPR